MLFDNDKGNTTTQHATSFRRTHIPVVFRRQPTPNEKRHKNTFRCFFIYLLGVQRRVRHKEKYVELLHLDATGDAVEVALSLRGDLAAVHATELALGLASAGGSSGGAKKRREARQSKT